MSDLMIAMLYLHEIEGEIRRYLSSGGKIDEYKKLLKENDLTIENLT